MVNRLGLALTFLALGTASGLADDLKVETPRVATLSPTMQRVYVADAALPHMVDGRIYLLDGADMSLKGMFEAGFAGMMLAAPDKHRLYVATTFYERLTRGKRSDVIQVFDDQSLKVVDEIPLPSRRAQALSYRSLFQSSSDGKLLLLQNATPATSVMAVDPSSKRQLEIASPGCYGIYPAMTRALRFATLCGDGTAGTITIAANLKSSERKTGAKVFDPDGDPLFIHAERDGDTYVFLSFKGKLVRMSVEGETAAVTETLDMAAGTSDWAPGGYQPFAVDAKAGVAYVLMHSGASNGSHKNPSAEIWAYDLRNKRLAARSPVTGLTSLTLAASDPTTLFAINLVDSKIVRLGIDSQTRGIKPTGEIKLGETAALIEAPR
ncbi:MAG: amine dehydrogenase large subunit [Xanthobacteraceae bacterium]|nr:amine dehydrogenase large subunit [Xanthobacteraceae bacterium]